MSKKKNNFWTYVLGFGLATLLVGIFSNVDLDVNNDPISNKINESSLVSNSSSVEIVDGFQKLKIVNNDLFTLDEGCYYTADGERFVDTINGYNSYIFEATENCAFYIECSLSNIQYVIKKADSCVRYQRSNGTYVDGKENTFDLVPGDFVYISSILDMSSLDFYLKLL